MSLKREFIDMLHLIIDPLLEDEESGYYNIEEDSYRDICMKYYGEDVTLVNFYECDSDCSKCSECKHMKVDVSFFDGEWTRNYLFGNKPDVKGIIPIKNRKQLMNEMFHLKKDLEYYKDFCAEFGKRYDDYLQYAREFAKQLKEDFVYVMDGESYSTLAIDPERLPIVFHTDYRKDTDLKSKTFVAGNMTAVGMQSLINIYCCMDAEKEIKQRLRHELIHYCLYINKTKHDDDDALFHALCQIYDANAYEKMPDEEQILYDKFNAAYDNLNALKEKQKLEEDSTAYRNAKLILLFAIGFNPHSVVEKDFLSTCTETLNKMSKERDNVA
ncbi:hypothetical protein [Blautia massiliensis (ex Liu et al. 2021)]|uniref:hypothetical protein n=1 Tax=Blautia massiliensis (ex Liu et al. 2021) TaxID=3062492 RepID=UPI003F8A44DA